MRREEKLQRQFDGSNSFSTRLGHSFRGFLFGGEGGGGEREGRVAAAAGQLSRAESNTTGIDIWRADGEDYYAAAAANANGIELTHNSTELFLRISCLICEEGRILTADSLR